MVEFQQKSPASHLQSIYFKHTFNTCAQDKTLLKY